MFKDGPAALEWVRHRILSETSGTLAVAFWGAGAIEQLGLDQRNRDAPLRIVCNLTMGGTNPAEIKRLVKLPNIELFQSDRLHGKVYRFKEDGLVTSSNASANGLSFEKEEVRGWHEAGLVTSDTSTLAALDAWLTALPRRKIKDVDLALAESRWQARRQADLRHDQTAQVLTDLIAGKVGGATSENTYLVAYTEPYLSKSGEDGAEKAQEIYGDNVDWFEDWPELPKIGVLVSFRVAADGKILRVDGVFRREGLASIELSNGKQLELCFKAGGKSIFQRERRHWQKAVDQLLQRPFDKVTGRGWLLQGDAAAGFIDLKNIKTD